jgi:hypothetical protein
VVLVVIGDTRSSRRPLAHRRQAPSDDGKLKRRARANVWYLDHGGDADVSGEMMTREWEISRPGYIPPAMPPLPVSQPGLGFYSRTLEYGTRTMADGTVAAFIKGTDRFIDPCKCSNLNQP